MDIIYVYVSFFFFDNVYLVDNIPSGLSRLNYKFVTIIGRMSRRWRNEYEFVRRNKIRFEFLISFTRHRL